MKQDSNEIRDWRDSAALERHEAIAPLLDNTLDPARKAKLRSEIAKNAGRSIRTISRWESSYKSAGFEGLRPSTRSKAYSQSLPENFEEILSQAVLLKRELPQRSVHSIIRILEIEGWAPVGSIKRSTLQRYLYNAGFGRKQMQRYAEARQSSSRRFCHAHRMELIQADIKYGPEFRTDSGRKIKTYLSSLIDDHSRFILHSEFYDSLEAVIVEESFHKAILRYGKFDKAYLDNGTQYISRQLKMSCGKLGIQLLHARPRSGESKGKIEKFHQVVDRFLAELSLEPVKSLEELNRRWIPYLEESYQKEQHAGIREYYELQGVRIPDNGISPYQEWNRDSRELVFISNNVVNEAFLHHGERRIDQAGCFSFQGKTYEASTSLIGAKVEIAWDPADTTEVIVSYKGIEPIHAKQVRISAYCAKKPPLPAAMLEQKSDHSRYLAAMEKKYAEDQKDLANAISFRQYEKVGE